MRKNIDSKNRIVYIPSSPDEDVFHNATRKKQLFVDENYNYQKSWLVRVCQWFLYYFIAKPLFYIYGKLYLGIKVKGKKNLKGIKTGAITVSNHVHYLDFSIATTFIGRWKRSHVISNRENFDVPVAGRLISAYGVMPLPDTPKATINFYKQISVYLKKKRFIHIFPEATMWPYYNKLRPFKSGAFHFAIANNVPVIPYVILFRKSKGVGKIVRKRPKITVVICKPIYANFDLDKKEQIADLCEQTHSIMQQVLDKNQSYDYFLYVKNNRNSQENSKE